jgi:hypothetical protein
MSDEMARVPEPEWPTHCEHCGTRLAAAQVDVFPGGDEQLDTVVDQDYCPNPDCPAKADGTAGSAGTAGGPRTVAGDEATDPRPGSLGGDNGGA